MLRYLQQVRHKECANSLNKSLPRLKTVSEILVLVMHNSVFTYRCKDFNEFLNGILKLSE